MKLGSLFDGSGGFPLAGSLCGITPVFASEVEPYPIAVTTNRFPQMRHLSDVSKVNGAEIEPVDILTFGSPCQDLSVAGKRAGLKHEDNGDDETTRSGLFMEAVRIIKEMRTATNGLYPTFALWENVPGAFSSNRGEDFRTVLEELIGIVEPGAVMPPVPKGGWSYADCYTGDGWSLAYRVFDAQYWGVPQRRRRIYLVLDLRGERAREVLFEREGLRGYFTKSGAEGESLATDAERSSGADDREGEGSNCLTPWDVQSRRIFGVDGSWPALYGGEGGGHGYAAIPCTMKNQKSASGGDVSACLYAAYGTKWNGNAGAYSGENFVLEEHVPYTMKVRCGVAVDSAGKAAGKGALIQTNKAATLSCNNDQYLFQPTAYSFDSLASNSMKLSNPHSGCREVDVSKTLDTSNPDPSKNQGGIAVVVRQPQPVCAIASSAVNAESISPCLMARAGTGGNQLPLVAIEKPVVAIDQQGGKGGANYAVDVMPTLCSDSHGTPHAVAFAQNQRDEVRILGDTAGALQAQPGMKQQTFIMDSIGGQAEHAWEGDVAPCLKASHYKFPPCVTVPAAGFCTEHSAQAGGVGFQEECAPTLRAGVTPAVVYDCRGNGDGKTASTLTGDHENRVTDYTSVCVEPVAFDGANITSPVNMTNPQPGDPCHTLNTDSRNYVVYCLDGDKMGKAERAGGSGLGIRPGDTMYTLTAKDVHGVCIPINDKATRYQGGGADRKNDGAGNGMKARDYKDATDLVLEECLTPWDTQASRVYHENGVWPTLQARENAGQNMQAVVQSDDEAAGVDCRNATEYSELNGTLQAKSNGGFSANCNQIVRVRYIVRRLTPTECARLQGFPDEWGHYPHKDTLTDEEYSFWLEVRNTHATINGKTTKNYTKDQILTWYNKLHTDSAEYKMWGNGIALPTALYVIQGMADALKKAENVRRNQTFLN